jgi:hypothetical protein
VIGGSEYRLKLGLRALAMYEESTGRTFSECTGLMQLSQMLYCVLTANNEDFKMGFDEFMVAADDLEVITGFSRWMRGEWERQNGLAGGESGDGDMDGGADGDGEGAKKKRRGRGNCFRRWCSRGVSLLRR